ncbi:hypothetical protein EMCRGX_G020059 [Ephydatia muelleri]
MFLRLPFAFDDLFQRDGSIVVVVSPLIALMKDQVAALNAKGVPAAYLSSDTKDRSGVTPDREKVKAVEEWPIPQNATEVRQFLGLASYYRRFIQNFANVAAPLHNLTQKDVVFSRAFKV